MIWYLLRLFGKRVLIGYGIIALLSVMILTSLHFSSRYGLTSYVSEQLTLIPWDITLFQTEQVHRASELGEQFTRIPNVRVVEELGLLRLAIVSPLQMEIDGEPVPIPWLVIASTTKPELLPSELRPSLLSGKGTIDVAVIGDLFGKIREASSLRLSTTDFEIFQGRIGMTSQIQRQDMVKWLLQHIGSVSFIPNNAIVVSVPLEVYRGLARDFQRMFREAGHEKSLHQLSNAYLPEVTHLIDIDQEGVVSPWDLEGSINRLGPIGTEVYRAGKWITSDAYFNSDLLVLLERMKTIGRLVSLTTLLVGIPLLWITWVLAGTLSRLIVLNDRRLIGIGLIRGVPMKQVERALLLALFVGGMAGGILGLGLGTGLTCLIYYLAGGSTLSLNFLLQGIGFSTLFLVVGVLLALLSGREVLRYVRRLTPREAVARILPGEESAYVFRFRWYHGATLLAGGYKIISWVAGFSPLLEVFKELLPMDVLTAFFWMESLLNFLAIPFFLYGLSGLLMWKIGWLQKWLSGLVAPLVGSLRWFVARHMALRPQRVVTLLFIAALVMSVSLSSQVGSDSFYGRALRSIKAQVGADLVLGFDMVDLMGEKAEVNAISHHQRGLLPQLSSIRSAIEKVKQVARVEVFQQFLVPGIYIPGQSGLILNLIENPENYLNAVYYENSLGLTRRFPEIVRSLRDGNVAASQGLFLVRKIAVGSEITLGNTPEGMAIRVPLTDVVAFLPGQPTFVLQQREGFATAEVDYLNHLFRSQASLIAAQDTPLLQSLQVLPVGVVFLVKAKEGVDEKELAEAIAAMLPLQPKEMRWQALERERLGRDMYVTLAIENMKVYMVGGLLLALISVLAISLANFLANRRTFALLRLRGAPLPLLLRISLSLFLVPVLVGVMIGLLFGVISGYGLAQVIWSMPRVYGAAEALSNRLVISGMFWAIALGLSALFAAMALGFGFWLFRRTAREAIGEK